MQHKLGIIVPYRNREEQLDLFVKHIQEYIGVTSFYGTDIDFEVIVVEQGDTNDFNRGKLLNIGFTKAEKLGCDYVVFHDIDMLPEDVDYSYSDNVTHLITELNTPEGFERDNFDEYFGGVTLFPSHVFKHINGYTNKYWGWGFEDDNLMLRCKKLGVTLAKKKVIQKQREGVGLSFNGQDSFVACPNVFNSRRDFTIFVNFTIDRTTPDVKNITDEYTIFSIPGRDTALTYNSFRNFAFQFWKKDLSSMNINSEHYPDGTYSAVITIENKADPKIVKLYINGELVGELTYDKLNELKTAKYIYLGVGDPERKEKQNYLHGSINTFAVYKECLGGLDIERLSKNIKYSLFSLNLGEPEVYYDGKFTKGRQLIDLSDNGNHGTMFNTKSVSTKHEVSKEVSIPIRRNGTFKGLVHKENGYTKGYWTDWSSRENQIDFIKKFYNNTLDYIEDGITTLEYNVIDDTTKGNYHHLTVTL